MSVPTTGPGDGGSLLPVPPRLLGLATVALSVVSLTAYGVYCSLVGDSMHATVVRLAVGFVALGLVLVARDELTDFFESS
ncbi:hypothetical protein [Haloarchaeobius sp. FL176]|uniref:hypothetical protein n=1 Tax=Haloarchaeobius sp. FL176 TaxID=2967129 RepID=UPI002147EFB9|nr:hypothetical protein [Haloarchaeobius sp. FL176]